MPENIVAGKDAEDVADFLAKYAGHGQGQLDTAVPVLDLKLIRKDPDGVRAALARRGEREAAADRRAARARPRLARGHAAEPRACAPSRRLPPRRSRAAKQAGEDASTRRSSA